MSGQGHFDNRVPVAIRRVARPSYTASMKGWVIPAPTPCANIRQASAALGTVGSPETAVSLFRGMESGVSRVTSDRLPPKPIWEPGWGFQVIDGNQTLTFVNIGLTAVATSN
jgi:hypothetical protein